MFLSCGIPATPVSTLVGWSCLSLLMWTPVFCAGLLNFMCSCCLTLCCQSMLSSPEASLQSSKKLLKILETFQAVYSISLIFFSVPHSETWPAGPSDPVYSVTGSWVIHKRDVYFGSQGQSLRSPRTWHACISLFSVESRRAGRQSGRHKQEAVKVFTTCVVNPVLPPGDHTGKALIPPKTTSLLTSLCPSTGSVAIRFRHRL